MMALNKEEDKYKNYETFTHKKRYMQISRLFSALFGMFVFITTLIGWLIHYIAGVILTCMSLAFLWYMVIDLMVDKYEDRLIDYEEFYGIKKPADKSAYRELMDKKRK